MMLKLSAIRFGAKIFAGIVAVSLCAAPANAAQFQVTFTNLQPTGGFTLTPAWVGFHNGSFDLFDGGAVATTQLEALAELGQTQPLSDLFNGTTGGTDFGTDAVLAQPAGFAGAPVVEPGETATAIINTGAGENFFSFASMLIPTNDTFIGNMNPTAFALPTTIGSTVTVTVGSFYDAGTEVNNPADGAPFFPGGDGTAGVAEGATISLENLADFNIDFPAGTNTAIGPITAPLQLVGGGIAQFTITAIPEPGSIAFFGVFGLAMAATRRRRKKA